MLTPQTGAMLRAARHRRGLSIREAAKVAGSSRGYLSQLELGQRAPSMTRARIIIRAYHLTEQEASILKAESVEGVGRDKPRAKAAA